MKPLHGQSDCAHKNNHFLPSQNNVVSGVFSVSCNRIMSALEKMRSFFRLCQCAGLFPFRMEINKQSGKFEQFSFSWRYPVTWWYITLAFSQLIMFYFMMSATLIMSTEKQENLPIIIYISITGSSAIFLLIVISVRFWITFHFAALRQAINHLKLVEQSLTNHSDYHHCTIKIRIVIGCICTLFWVSMHVAEKLSITSINKKTLFSLS